jgi:DNA-binding response OmpR family regulator
MSDQPKKLLIIDDDKFLLDIYSVKFKESGFEVSPSFGAEEALKKIREGYVPDVVLLDMVMPGLDGIGFLNLAGGASIIVLSNQSQEADVEKARQFNVDGYIIKANNTPSEVLAKVGEIISKK